MASALAFFPWVYLGEALEVSTVRLIPWVKSETPLGLPHADLKDIDAVLGAYVDRPRQPISRAILLEVADWELGKDPTGYIEELFYARVIIGFSALSMRSLFTGSFNYCSYDSYRLVVQKYQEESAESFAFTTRRRDGGANQLWSSEEYAFHRPHHVNSNVRSTLNRRLLSALLPREKVPDHVVSAINEYNLANTDSEDVPERAEIVMMKSAFECLFQINQNASEFAKCLKAVLGELDDPKIEHTPAFNKWFEKRPRAERLIECWAREFCDMRGVAAHGRTSIKSDRFVWAEFWHLAFAAVLFPLLVKRELRSLGLLDDDEYDIEQLRHVELYLATDPIRSENQDKYAQHPWAEVDSKSLEASRIRQVSQILDTTDWE